MCRVHSSAPKSCVVQLRRGFFTFLVQRCGRLGWHHSIRPWPRFFLIQRWIEHLSQKPLHIVCQNTDEKMVPHPHFGVVANRTSLEIDIYHAANDCKNFLNHRAPTAVKYDKVSKVKSSTLHASTLTHSTVAKCWRLIAESRFFDVEISERI